ncbi:hypothetical protein CO057_03395 [Candidatus Uhrbacteria bacterium CG_4_9_14_0_2_um_filter_41_50]|uniref:DUF11 domain-containing protein n=1 Tax=Candidatus Uhrbacteria bacterium CG_4_9_14_0_2_um_filter_41_50 TaxID=1975031 RepID=A0A2M8ENM3_9BACT|nr:MAG: hypothetical protein COZ45_02405 [Candidatus Uhrbacteria bacterium CG_4_10_14_3_um_filter_41_21]PIZ54254.1 MAG: hypothetical protein COY24_04560 [Candidatus Uhrbacteria bacterium CG_4_10_14_0_2_um_filter_41_21]PJB84423.1 MAG: hypothetical protein CO086_03645 [Candidatus Uhrbacteria bacterium CG_4_9_14_0_8_um_filter_41_16]PJC24344.1 MAG: hypothetical protein CO057_03395 [Candidatus Uhrbacteria bacterium CG_4_9_14_0_2_um_filter_41_50]PJE75293.1 MAG: hypothetical protein COV03_00810 [Candi
MENKNQELICESKKDPKTHKNLLVCSYQIGAQAGKHVTNPIKMILKRNYFSERSHLHKALDVLVLSALALTVVGLVYLSLPKFTPNFINISATVAPAEVITGGSSTLTFTYENKSDETISNAKLSLGFPAHFELAEIETQDAKESGQMSFDLGDIAPNQYGVIHVRGTMFGDVGGEQIFTTTLNYNYGEENTPDEKVIEHVFSPTKSTLELSLVLPEYKIAYQQVEGKINYTNTGDVTFPDLTIQPDWPDSFELLSSIPTLQSDGFHVKGIEPGETGVIDFIGILGTPDDSTYAFLPSFEFDDVRYTQNTLKDTIEILPSPLEISHTAPSVITPGANTTFEIFYNNISDYALNDVELRLSASDGILTTSKLENGFYVANIINEIAPNESGSVEIIVPVRSSFASVLGQNITLQTKPSAQFSFQPDSEVIKTNTFGSSTTTPTTSPIILQSFGRFWTASGDQLGRGFLPPRAGQETKIWVFWNVSGTTNDISNLRISADLGPGVTFTGRQSVSVGSSVYTENGSIVWSVGSISATNNGNIAGAAFEVAITPTADQVGKIPLLIYAPYVSATDNYTGAAINDAGSSVTTYLSTDSKAAELGGTVME